MPGVLPAASPRFPKAREPWKPRPGDGISPDWLIAELTHRQAHGLKLQYRAYLDEIAIVNSGFGGARLGRGDGGAISRERVRKLVAGRRSVRCGPLGQPWAGPGA